MQLYLPIAEMSVNILALLAFGGLTGILSGMFGIGGGFLLTPFLILLGIPPTVAVASTANQTIAASVSGFLTHWRRKNVDIQMGLMMLGGGLAGSIIGVWLFSLLEKIGQIDLVIALSYIVFLGTIGLLMATESIRAIFKMKRKARKPFGKRLRHSWLLYLPFKMRFRKSYVVISPIVPVTIGFIVGIMVSIMGIGGGFLTIPAMIYIIGMPASVVVGTSLFQMIFVTANVTLLHAITTQTVDVLLALLLLSGSVVGAQFGIRLAGRIPSEFMRAALAIMVLGVTLRLALSLFVPPDADERYTVILEQMK